MGLDRESILDRRRKLNTIAQRRRREKLKENKRRSRTQLDNLSHSNSTATSTIGVMTETNTASTVLDNFTQQSIGSEHLLFDQMLALFSDTADQDKFAHIHYNDVQTIFPDTGRDGAALVNSSYASQVSLSSDASHTEQESEQNSLSSGTQTSSTYINGDKGKSSPRNACETYMQISSDMPVGQSISILSLTTVQLWQVQCARFLPSHGLNVRFTLSMSSPVVDSWIQYESESLLVKTGSLDRSQSSFEVGKVNENYSHRSAGVVDWSVVPDNMRPTSLQIAFPHHHVLVDIVFPWPAVRNRLLLRLKEGLLDKLDLARDMLQHPTITGQPQPFMIWGSDPCDETNWEFSKDFLQKYHYLFDSLVLKQTNWWRCKRKLDPLCLSLPDIPSL